MLRGRTDRLVGGDIRLICLVSTIQDIIVFMISIYGDICVFGTLF